MKSPVSITRFHCSRHDERGTGIVGTMFGAVVFLSFTALATHTLIGLYATSVVSAAAWDGARLAADDPTNPVALANADASVRQRLSGLHHVSLLWSDNDADDISLTITADRPSLLPHSLAIRTSLTTINRTVVIRKEEPQDDA